MVVSFLLRFVFFILLIFLHCTSFSQVTIEGKIFDRSNHEPIPFANIGILNSDVGTLSNADGSFLLKISLKLSTDTLQVSALGFFKKVIPISLLAQKKQITIYLAEKATVLETVTITERKEKNKIFEIGNRGFNGGVMETDTLYAGRSMALLIENDQSLSKKGFSFPVYLEKARIRILRNNLKSCRFRIRLNEVDSITGQPGEDLLQQSIIVESSARSGWIEFDLTSLNFIVSKPFFVTFEQITDVNDRTRIVDGYSEFMRLHPKSVVFDTVYIDGKQEVRQKIRRGGIDLPGTFIAISASATAGKKYHAYERNTSFSEWIRVRGIVTATVTVSNQRLSSAKQNDNKSCREEDVNCKIEKICNDFVHSSGVNGIQICVSKGNEIRFSSGFGLADVANGIPVTDSTRFRINSISKALTSAALIKLLSEQKLDLDEPVQKYVPEFPLKEYPVTTRQLAGHLAGFRDYNENDPGDYIRTEHYKTAREALKVFMNDTLLFKPGTRFSYSTFGWNLIGAVIEGASGENYLEYMHENIFKPLKMNATCGDIINTGIPNRSKFYDAIGDENDLGDWSYKYSGGGLLSTTSDLVRFGNEILHGNYVDARLKKILFDSQLTSDGGTTGYGIGWYTGRDRNGHRIWHHAGDSFSGSSHLIIYPDDDIVIAFLANGQEGVLFGHEDIAELFYK